ncbi:hypothetical protein [Natronococcus wangiae]|uniref:hypothetical protein n=1 Tax=Natronococcus wangiae TaxID=3068275 RepID=UPI00273FC165|nr:hypothetical protein [Natronococcus sp. AD5]
MRREIFVDGILDFAIAGTPVPHRPLEPARDPVSAHRKGGEHRRQHRPRGDGPQCDSLRDDPKQAHGDRPRFGAGGSIDRSRFRPSLESTVDQYSIEHW